MNSSVYLPNGHAATPLEGIKDITADNTKHAIWTLMLSLLVLITTFKRKSVMGQSYYSERFGPRSHFKRRVEFDRPGERSPE